MKNISTGTGIALLAGAIFGSTIIMRFGAADQDAHAAPPMEAAKAFVAASIAQVTPTIVWYGSSTYSDNYSFHRPVLFRAWSDGRVDFKRFDPNASGGACGGNAGCSSQWFQVSSFSDGLNAASDINLDGKVDGNDLGQLLAAWGDAPRQDIPPSDCPLNLINP
jgi:hypothetical protein